MASASPLSSAAQVQAVTLRLIVALALNNLVKAFTNNIINPLIASIQVSIECPELG